MPAAMLRRLVYEEPVSRQAVWSLRLALFAFVVLAIAGWSVRSGEPSLPGLAPLVAGFLLAGVALGLSVSAFVQIWREGRRGAAKAAQAAVLSGLMLVPAALAGVQILRLPQLTDVSTDIDDPPSFGRSRLVMEARQGRVPPEVAKDLRRRQREAYPRILPIVVDLSPEIAFDLARRAALARGWRIIEAIPPGGRTGAARIEAVARTRILRFADDITIRVRPRADGSRIDVRSASRLGSHDLGANADRIAAFSDEVAALIEAR